MAKKILFIVPYPLKESPSQRFRFEQYFQVLQYASFTYDVQSFLNSNNWQLFYTPGNFLLKSLAIVTGFTKRFLVLFKLPLYDFVFIHREAAPLGPPLIEWLLANVWKKKVIYDFDDAIWMTDRREESFAFRLIKARSKVRLICKWAYKISCGNDYLCAYARKYNAAVFFNPTTIDTDLLHNPDLFSYFKNDEGNGIIIGWTGSHSTLKYLTDIEPTLIKIELQFPEVKMMVIADRKPTLTLSSLEFILWNETTEISDLMKIDIGIMPLPDDEWAKGKCGFKALQYMALKIPAVASPVGVNLEIVTHGVDGFLARTQEEWYTYLVQLIKDKALRNTMGQKGRQKVIDQYSVRSNAATFLSLFE